MYSVDLTKACIDSINQISDHIEDSIVYLDAGCTESFQFLGAFSLLLQLGARSVCSLENTTSLDTVVDWNSRLDSPVKVLVITSRILSDAHRYILRCLSRHQQVHCCAIFTSISEVAHSAFPDSPLGPDAFREYELLLIQDYEELVKSCEKKSGKQVDSNFQENITVVDEGWSRLTSSVEDIPPHETTPSGMVLNKDSTVSQSEDVGQKLVVSVHHFPMMLCPLSPGLFVLPSEGSVAEAFLSVKNVNSVSPGLPPLSAGLLSDGDDFPPGATLTANFLYHLAAKMDLKMEIFSLGDLSKAVGKLLVDMSSLYDIGRRKRSAGLLLVDRTLDLLTPCCHGDSFVDRIFSCLPRRERTTSSSQIKGSQAQLKVVSCSLHRAPIDVQIPLDEILREEDSGIQNSRLLESIGAFLRGWDSHNTSSQVLDEMSLSSNIISQLTGSFVSTESFRGTPQMDAILERKAKDGVLLVKKLLQEALLRENVTVNIKSRPGVATKSELRSMIQALAKNQSTLLRHKGIVQLGVAALVALDESFSSRWDAFSSAEKILRVNAGDTSQSLASQIGDLINKSALQKRGKLGTSRGLLSFQDSLLLTIVGYILGGENFPTSGSCGPFSWQEEHFLKETIVDAILENPSIAKLKFLNGLAQELEANLERQKSRETKESVPDQLDTDNSDDEQWDKWGEEEEEEEEDDDDKGKEKAYDDMQLKLELHDRVDSLFKFLHKLSAFRSNNGALREEGLLADPYTSKGFLYKLVSKVLGKYEVPGLEYHSSTVGRLFKSGFGRFGLGQAKPSLDDQNIILIFVIGGVNGLEVREIREALSESERPNINLLVGGTTLLTSDDMLDLLLGDLSYA